MLTGTRVQKPLEMFYK